MADAGGRDEMHLVRDVLDKQLIDHAKHDPMGMVDGVVIELRDVNQPPHIVAIESGFPVLARRVSPKLEPIVRMIGRRLGVRRGIVYRIPWSRVRSHDVEVELDVDADRTPAKAWEHWLRRHVTRYIPGSGNFLQSS
jgi:hypothetical protein